jgi:hypothetical protein
MLCMYLLLLLAPVVIEAMAVGNPVVASRIPPLMKSWSMVKQACWRIQMIVQALLRLFCRFSMILNRHSKSGSEVKQESTATFPLEGSRTT